MSTASDSFVQNATSELAGFDAERDCPKYDDTVDKFIEEFSFWTDGVLKSLIAVLGLAGNAIAIAVLVRPAMRNSFNLLLVTLALIDSTYLFLQILEAFRIPFSLRSDVHILFFPHLLYPLLNIALTASVFMTVAIAVERYVAVHYPLDYNLVRTV